ncbi:META domain-containing protein [Micromonospora sp. NPDC049523]|uniref:META domain-containing protein n=1 Tax=Micromonospora sp. NPDC049523 TaxID=3155921 RepID=UPI003423A5D0
MVRQGYLTMLIACGVLLAGCDGQSDAGRFPGTVEVSRSPMPEGLIGSWTIIDLDDPGGGRILRLAHNELYLVGSDCDTLGGSWRADTDGVFLADVYVATAAAVEGLPGCELASQVTPEWLRRVTAYRFDYRGLPVLLDELDRPVARLVPGATPTAGPDMLASVLDPPVVTDEARRAFAPAAALPATLVPADPRGLVGRWAPAEGHRTAYAEFTADGEWRGSDGCNEESGRWIVAAGGTLLTTGRMVTAMFCADGVSVGHWLWTARRAGFDGDVLVLLDAEGKETGRLRNAG